MIQNNEFFIVKETIRYLIKLGYYEADIHSNIRIKNRECDLVIYKNQKPYIAIETKSSISNVNDSELRFNPIVIELQYKASLLAADYYVITDGRNYMWFENDKYGRPKLLKDPIAKIESVSNDSISKDTLIQAIRKTRYYLGNNINNISELLLIILVVWVEDKKGNCHLKDELINKSFDDRFWTLVTNQLSLNLQLPTDDTLKQVFKILDYVDLFELQLDDILSAIDEELLANTQISGPRLPKWLSDFIVRLTQTTNNSKLLSISSSYGDISVALLKLKMNDHKNILDTIEYDTYSYLYSMLKQSIIGYSWRYEGNHFCRNIREFPKYNDISNIILLPCFGRKEEKLDYDSYISSIGVKRYEDLSLEYSIKALQEGGRIVTILPESLLYSDGNRILTRKFITDNARISAVISLPLGTIMPFGRIKASIVVLDVYNNRGKLQDYDIFMAELKDYIITDTVNCSDIPEVKEILFQYENRKSMNTNNENKNVKIIRFNKLENLNLSVNYYDDNDIDIYMLGYDVVSLEEIVLRVKRGKRIKIDKQGDYQFVGPAAIRPMIISINNLDTTTLENLGANDIVVNQGDLVFNNIGNHLGAAAVIDDDLVGKAISQHVIMIRPNSSKVIPEYLAAVINSTYVKSQIKKLATGTVVSSLKLDKVLGLQIPLPDFDTQTRIINNLVNAKNNYIKAKENYIRAQSNYVNILTNFLDEEEK